MPNGYRKVAVNKPYFSWREEGGAETGNKFNKPTRNRKYVKILALCLTYAPIKLIYHGVKNPLQHQVRDLCRAGLLERYQRAGKRCYYYKTTPAGFDLLAKAISV